MKSTSFPIIASLLLTLLFLSHASPEEVYGKIVSCRGCSLNRLPILKEFLQGQDGAKLYKNVEIQYIKGQKARMTVYKGTKSEEGEEEGEVIEEIVLSDLKTAEEMHETFERLGFVKYSQEELDEMDAAARKIAEEERQRGEQQYKEFLSEEELKKQKQKEEIMRKRALMNNKRAEDMQRREQKMSDPRYNQNLDGREAQKKKKQEHLDAVDKLNELKRLIEEGTEKIKLHEDIMKEVNSGVRTHEDEEVVHAKNQIDQLKMLMQERNKLENEVHQKKHEYTKMMQTGARQEL